MDTTLQSSYTENREKLGVPFKLVILVHAKEKL